MKPILVILAAGVGARFGGLKQAAPVDSDGNSILHYSVYDAKRAGFERVVCVVNPENQQDFINLIGKKLDGFIDVQYAPQRLDDLPKGYTLAPGRSKPWGTAHALLAAKKFVDGRFAVINADDFYGAASFAQIYELLAHSVNEHQCAMVGFHIENTLTENGSVSRGVCEVDDSGFLTNITERTGVSPAGGFDIAQMTRVSPDGDSALALPHASAFPHRHRTTPMPCPSPSITAAANYVDESGQINYLPAGTIVSMNHWGFHPSFMDEIEKRFRTFLDDGLVKNPQSCEYYLPYVVNDALRDASISVKVEVSKQKWHGITYQEDLPVFIKFLKDIKASGAYPEHLFKK